jgi:hypothetical protein
LDGQNGFVKAVLGNWETAMIMNFFSGAGMRIIGSMNGACYLDVVVNTAGTANNCDQTINPATIDPVTGKGKPFGKYGFFSGNPWGIGNAQNAATAPNRNFSQPCHLSNSPRTQWLNQQAFTWEGFKLGGYPNSGQGMCSGPGVQDVDFSISKNWGMPFHGNKLFGEKSRIQFRLEFFNLLNHPMFRETENHFDINGGIFRNGTYSCAANGVGGAASCSLGNNNFGLANTPSNIGNREIQYALKILF